MLSRMLDNVSSIALGGHTRPDGDCTGSCLGLYQYLKNNYPDKETDIYLEDIPKSYQFLERSGEIRHEIPESKRYDLFIALDCGDAERLGFAQPLFGRAKSTFCIDHHVSNEGFARDNYVLPDASSTSELVYDLIDHDKITKGIAEALYLGIVHDTGVFQYACAGPSTFEAAAALLRVGIDAPRLITETYYEKTYAQNQIMGRALMESILFMDGRCIASYVRQKDMEFYKVTAQELDGVVSQLRVTKGVEVAVFMYELSPSVYKVSLRSKDVVDVSRAAQYFGGGGHVRAAGFTMAGTPYDVLNNLARQIEPQLNDMRTPAKKKDGR